MNFVFVGLFVLPGTVGLTSVSEVVPEQEAGRALPHLKYCSVSISSYQ